MTRAARAFFILASIVLLTTAPAWAQLSTAELNGRVTDSSYAASFIKLADGTLQRLGQDVEGIFGTKIWR